MILNTAVANIICSLLFSERYEYDDEEFSTILNSLDTYFDMSVKVAMVGKYFGLNQPKTSPYIEINRRAIHLGWNFKVSCPRAKSLFVLPRLSHQVIVIHQDFPLFHSGRHLLVYKVFTNC